MKLPDIGELNRRVKLFGVETPPAGAFDLEERRTLLLETWGKFEISGGSSYWDSVNVDATVTHRIYLRYSAELGTRPQDLGRLTEVSSEGTVYRVRRVTDVNAAHRFTMLECEELRQEEEGE